MEGELRGLPAERRRTGTQGSKQRGLVTRRGTLTTQVPTGRGIRVTRMWVPEGPYVAGRLGCLVKWGGKSGR